MRYDKHVRKHRTRRALKRKHLSGLFLCLSTEFLCAVDNPQRPPLHIETTIHKGRLLRADRHEMRLDVVPALLPPPLPAGRPIIPFIEVQVRHPPLLGPLLSAQAAQLHLDQIDGPIIDKNGIRGVQQPLAEVFERLPGLRLERPELPGFTQEHVSIGNSQIVLQLTRIQ